MRIVLLECRRIIYRRLLIIYFASIIIVSVYDSLNNIDRYNMYNDNGISVTWRDNLAEAVKTSEGLYLDRECMEDLRADANRYGYVNGENISELIEVNYGKTIWELSDDELNNFFQTRVDTIKEKLTEDTEKGYTNADIDDFMDKADDLSALSMGYAEGYKALEEKMGQFIFLIVVVISALMLQLFGHDPSEKMTEIVRSSKLGQKKLDGARIIAAYFSSTVLYVCSISVYIITVMIPFGFAGADQPVQSNVRTFFSLYNITYSEQLFMNIIIGYVALLFMVSLVLFITIILKNILESAAVTALFLLMLVIFNKMSAYPVNHMFANFLPVRMTDFRHIYVEDELYRICGVSISCMNWSVAVSLIMSFVLSVVGGMVLNVRRKNVSSKKVD